MTSLFSKVRFFLLSFLLIFFVNPVSAKDYITSIFLVLDDGSPITDSQDIRLSLWSDGRYESGDVDGAGAINTGAAHYSDYSTAITLTPDSMGRVSIALQSLPDFPQIVPGNQFLMIEYKDDADPDTSYVIYDDQYINSTEMDRFPLIKNGPDIYESLYTNDATSSDVFILDRNDDATDITIQFGNTLAESLHWNDANGTFQLSDDLHVDGMVTMVSLFIENTSNDLSFRVNDEASDGTPFVIDAAGNVGIGTDTPGAALHLIGDAQLDGELNLSAFDAARLTTIVDPGDSPLPDIDGYLIVNSSGDVEKMQTNEGVVKVNGDINGMPTYNVLAGVEQQITYTSPLTISSSTSWPETAPSDEDSFYDFATDKFLENPVNFQSHLFRVIVNYAGFSVGGTDQIVLRLLNPLSGFENTSTVSVPKGFTFGTAVFDLWTIADSASIGNGYELYLQSTSNATLEVNSITRFSFHKD